MTSDVEEIVRIGLSEIPANCRLAEAVHDTVGRCRDLSDWESVWDRIFEKYGHYHGVHIPRQRHTRSRNDHELRPAIKDDLTNRPLDDLKVAFPMRDVVSAHLFDRELAWNNAATTAGGLATSGFPGRHGRTVIQWAEGSKCRSLTPRPLLLPDSKRMWHCARENRHRSRTRVLFPTMWLLDPLVACNAFARQTSAPMTAGTTSVTSKLQTMR